MPQSMSGIIETQILHTTTTRMLHAHNFNKSSSQATYVLTYVLSRYLTLLAETCARYAEHAGRTGVTMWDALAALNEIGVEIDELREFADGEGKETLRYTAQTARRADELAEMGAVISEGLRGKCDAIQLTYQPILENEESSEDEDMEEALESESVTQSNSMQNMAIEERRKLDLEDIPAARLSPSPIPPSPKRLRTAIWDPPEYVPDFLPPFPGLISSPKDSPSQQIATYPLEVPLNLDLNSTKANSGSDQINSSTSHLVTTGLASQAALKNDLHRPAQLAVRQPSPALGTSSPESSSYLIAVPYENSSLASIPEWHLPKDPHPIPPAEEPSTLPVLLSSHSYLQSVSLSAPSVLPPNPQRHTLSMILLGLSARAYSPAATLFASSTTNTCIPVPRRAAPLATHAVPLDKHGKVSFSILAGKGALPLPPPEWHARSAGGPVAFVQPTFMQGSKIPNLARMILSSSVLARTTRIVPPPPLERNDQKLLYGPPIPAPWNIASGGPEVKGKGGKDKEEEEEEEADKVLAEAHLFATWDYDPKDFRAILPPPRRGMVPLKRKRSESIIHGRRGSDATYG